MSRIKPTNCKPQAAIHNSRLPSNNSQPATRNSQPITTLLTSSRTLNIAHRGARSLAPENTLAAARKAFAIGSDMWELDVGMTADGELVVIHDDTLERTSNAAEVFPGRRPWRMRDFTLEELRSLDFGSWFAHKDPFGQVAAGAVSKAEIESYTAEPIPMLHEALSFTKERSWYVNVEIKKIRAPQGRSHVVERVVSMIEDMQMSDRVILSSFDHGCLELARAISSNIVIGALVDRPVANPVPLLRGLRALAYHPRVSVIRLEEIAELRELGFAVNVWTANGSDEMQTLIKSGVSGIFTDFPQLLKFLLESP